MASVIALAKHTNVKLQRTIIATTRWIASDPSSNIVALLKAIDPLIPIVSINLNFSNAPYEGLRYYEKGYVKEGVGAGGTAFLAHVLMDKNFDELEKAVYEEYGELINN
ncbi:MAG: hypothetical protein QW701_01470 [Candidatus Nezhaarchaeales archaeon]